MWQGDAQCLYVGKAKHLKKRLQSYFRSQLPHRLQWLMQTADRITWTVTANEREALLLEAAWIKRYTPKFNILLRDDKSYPWIVVNTDHPFPRIDMQRGRRKKKGVYFGPYPSAQWVRETLKCLQKLFMLRTCSDHVFAQSKRPCLQYDIGCCTAPCVGRISVDAYQDAVSQARLFLAGTSKHVEVWLRRSMEEASDRLAFERAAYIRDQLTRLSALRITQCVVGEDKDFDVLVVGEPMGAWWPVTRVVVRGGQVLGVDTDVVSAPGLEAGMRASVVLEQFLVQHHSRHEPPQLLMVQDPELDRTWFEKALSTPAHPVRIRLARGEAMQRLIQFAQHNAQEVMRQHDLKHSRHAVFLERLSSLCDRACPIQWVVAMDISHHQGQAAVGSVVAADPQGLCKKAYRRYQLGDAMGGDDPAALSALTQRYAKRWTAGSVPIPDVMLVDGGLPQVRAVCDALSGVNMQLPAVWGVAKGQGRRPGLETLIAPDGRRVRLDPMDPLLNGVLRLRDEAHRFAVRGHRQQKKKQLLAWPRIPGVGAHKRKALMAAFGGWQGLLEADVRAIAQVAGMGKLLAERVVAHLHGDG